MVALLSALACWKLLKYIPSFEKLLSILVSGAVMGIIFHISSDLSFLLRALFGAGLYFFLLWALKAVSTEEIISIISRKGGPIHEPEVTA